MNVLININKNTNKMENLIKWLINFFWSNPENHKAFNSFCSSNLEIVTIKDIKKIISDNLEIIFGRIASIYKK